MRFAMSALTTLAASITGATLAFAAPATAAPNPNQVVAFSHEFTPLEVWTAPMGCHALPPGTHLLFNQTPKSVTMYSDPLCMFPLEPFSEVKPNFGTHVSAIGSFRA